MQRISVVGNSGSGKTTLAGQLAAALAIPHLELVSVFHQPGWQPLDPAEFLTRVEAFTAGPSWVVDGNYSAVRPTVWSRADTVVWLDLPRSRVICRVITGTLRRIATRAELWNGNREPLTNLFRLDPELSIIAWAWTKHHDYRERFISAQAYPVNAHLRFVRLGSAADVAAFLRSVAGRPAPR